MNYLERQIFPFSVEWSDATQRSLTFDLRETAIGFGAEYFIPLATYTVNGWNFSILLQSGADFLTFESFADSLVGRLQGFWLPCPLAAAKFSAGVSTTQFDIVYEDLTDTWNSRPDQHLLLTYPDGTQRAAQIQGVAVNVGGATERVTLTAALAEIPPTGTVITRLHYVRFSDDVESQDFLKENIALMKIAVVELPLEYTNAATGLQPVYFYHFWANAPVNIHWRYTSFAAPVASNGQLFSVFPMSHGPIKKTTDGNCNTVEIKAKPDATHPFSMMAGIPPGKVLWCEISRAYLATPDATTKIFSGFVDDVEDEGPDYVAHCLDRLFYLKTKLPRFLIGTACNHVLYDPNTCRAKRAVFETTCTLTAILAGQLPVVQCTFNMPFNLENYKTDDWFKGGIFECGMGVQYEIRSILCSHWDGAALNLTLNSKLNFAAAGALVQVVSGCDHSSTQCQLKFFNFENFGGFMAVPDSNLSLKGLNTSVSQGGKKA